ncbi:MAG: phosphoribosylanthranilate isomerase [Fimbriimonadaceae bacterium]
MKICGLTQVEDVEKAIEYGADALGFIFEPTSRRCIETNPDILNIRQFIGPFGKTIAVYHSISAPPPPDFDLIQAAEGFELEPERTFQVLRVSSETTLEDLLTTVSPDESLAGVLLDTFSTAGYGGTGESLDWGLAAELASMYYRPVILAGGLNPNNVAEAIRVVKPYAVDVSSGVESSSGVKDWLKMRDFIQAARG